MVDIVNMSSSLVFLLLGVTISTVVSSEVIYYFPLNSTTVKGVVKNGSCTDLGSSTVQGTTPASIVQGPNSTHSDPALNFAPDNWVNLGDFKGTCMSDPKLCSSSGLSVSFWLRVNASVPGDRHILTTGKLDTSRGIQVFIANSHTNVVICDGTKRYPTEIDFPSSWTHITAVYNPAGSTAADKFYVYINGVKKETARYAVKCDLSDQDTHLLIGHESNSGSVNGRRPFAITQLAFYNKVLSQAEVQQIQSNVTSGIVLNCPVTALPTTPNSATGESATTSPSGGGSGSGSKQMGNDSDGGSKRSPVVLILLSVALFVLIIIVIAFIIACCIIIPNAKGKGYKFI